MVYATVRDLEVRWRSLTPSESERAEALLDDAAVMLREYEGENLDVMRVVSCNMVKRAMETNGDAFGIDGQVTPSMGWAESLPAGELYVKPAERRMLANGTVIFSVRATR